MIRVLILLIGSIAFTGILVHTAIGDDAAPEKPIRVLLTYGGHDFEEDAFFALWDRMEGVVYTRAPLPESASLFRPGLEKDYDVVVLYDMADAWNADQREAFRSLLDRGVGIVSMHHNLNANRSWPLYRDIIGGQWITEPTTIDGKVYDESTYDHDQDVRVTVADRDHPITRGLEDFTIHDEVYGKVYVVPDVHVLLTTDHPRSVTQLAWTHPYGKSRVVYLMGGHDSKAWNHPTYWEILRRSIIWAAPRHESTTANP